MHGYDPGDDPYLVAGSDVLINRLGILDASMLAEFETISVTQRSEEPLPAGRLSKTHYLAVHRHLFQDVYAWAGRLRTVRIAKDGNEFCYPENIAGQLDRLFGWLRNNRYLVRLTAPEFSHAGARFLSELNAIHPFREGNGRTQNAFFAMLAAEAGHPVDFSRLVPAAFLQAMIRSFHGDLAPLETEIGRLIE